MRSPEAFEVMAIHLARGRPALGAAEDDHWPAWPESFPGTPCLFLDLADFQDAMFQGSGHRLMHAAWITAFHKIRCVAIPDEQRLQFLVTDAGQKRWVIDFVTVEVQDRQHRTIGNWVEKFIAMPARGKRPRFRLAVAHHDESYQIGIALTRPVARRDTMPKPAPLMDAPGVSGVAWLPIPPGKENCLK